MASTCLTWRYRGGPGVVSARVHVWLTEGDARELMDMITRTGVVCSEWGHEVAMGGARAWCSHGWLELVLPLLDLGSSRCDQGCQ